MSQEITNFSMSAEELMTPDKFALKVLNTSLNGLYVYDVKLGKNIFINEQYTRLTGYTLKEIQAMDEAQFFARFHPEDQQRVADHIERILHSSDDMLEVEYRFITKDGRWIWCLSRDSVFSRNKDGAVSQFIGTFFDITERKDSETKFRELFETLTQGVVFQIPPDGQIVDTNSAAEQLLGLSREEMVGRKPKDPAWQIINEDASEHNVDENPALVALCSGQAVRNKVLGIYNPQRKKHRWLHVDAVPQFRPGEEQPYLAYTLFSDITERRQLEKELYLEKERLRIAKESANLGIHDYDVATDIIHCDERVRELWGLEPQTPFTYELFMSGLYPDDRQQVQEKVDKALDPKGKGEYFAEYRVVSLKDGIERWVAATGRVLFESGKAGRLIGTVQDITQRKKAEEINLTYKDHLELEVAKRTAEIEAQYKKLKKLNKIIKQLSRKTIEAMESDRKALSKEIHDGIAGTLAAIKMQLESHLNTAANWSDTESMPLEKIVLHLKDVIKETKNISLQLRSLTLDDFGLIAALNEHIEHFEGWYPEINIDAQIEIDEKGIPLDTQTVLYRVTQEALNNIGKHSEATVVSIKLVKEQGHICLKVADNGCGFDIQTVLSDAGSLMGYGIHSMRERIEICKGKFGIHSEPEKGTAIEVFIPA